MKLVFIRCTYVNAHTYKHTVPHKRTHTLSHIHTQAVCAHMKGADKRWQSCLWDTPLFLWSQVRIAYRIWVPVSFLRKRWWLLSYIDGGIRLVWIVYYIRWHSIVTHCCVQFFLGGKHLSLKFFHFVVHFLTSVLTVSAIALQEFSDLWVPNIKAVIIFSYIEMRTVIFSKINSKTADKK